MKKLSLVLAAVMIALLAAVPASATGTSAFAPGEIIYCENFSGVPDTDDLAVIESSLDYRVVAVDTSTLDYKITEKNISETAKYYVKDGKLYITALGRKGGVDASGVFDLSTRKFKLD